MAASTSRVHPWAGIPPVLKIFIIFVNISKLIFLRVNLHEMDDLLLEMHSLSPKETCLDLYQAKILYIVT